MTPFGKHATGKEEVRKEMSVIAMAHRTTFVHQSTLGNINHMIEGFIDGMNSRRPALFNTYAVCQPEHGVADDATARQSKMALESRAYPSFSYNPDLGITFEDGCSIEGNPSIDSDWVSYDLKYIDQNGKEASMTLPFTFADFALTEGRFSKQFRKAPPETWNDNMVLISDFIDMDEDEREGLFPFIWATDHKGRLMRALVTAELVTSTIERRDFWRQLKSLAGVSHAVDVDQLVEQTRVDMAQKLTSSLLAMAAGGNVSALGSALTASPAASPSSAAAPADYEPVWIETPECTACDECVEINPAIFAYNDEKKAIVVNPKAGSYLDIVKAAEKCTAEVIHPGTPFNLNEANIDKLIKRAEKFQ
jgi:pyruvate-ferredoxin/flavodoxin oxidoreductase